MAPGSFSGQTRYKLPRAKSKKKVGETCLVTTSLLFFLPIKSKSFPITNYFLKKIGRGRGDVNGCPVVDPNHFWNGEGFIVTWLINGDGKQDNVEDPCQKFTAEEVNICLESYNLQQESFQWAFFQAEKYCALAGGHAVSLDSNERAEHFMDQV